MTKLVKNLIIGGTSTVTVTGGGVGIALALHKNKTTSKIDQPIVSSEILKHEEEINRAKSELEKLQSRLNAASTSEELAKVEADVKTWIYNNASNLDEIGTNVEKQLLNAEYAKEQQFKALELEKAQAAQHAEEVEYERIQLENELKEALARQTKGTIDSVIPYGTVSAPAEVESEVVNAKPSYKEGVVIPTPELQQAPMLIPVLIPQIHPQKTPILKIELEAIPSLMVTGERGPVVATHELAFEGYGQLIVPEPVKGETPVLVPAKLATSDKTPFVTPNPVDDQIIPMVVPKVQNDQLIPMPIPVAGEMVVPFAVPTQLATSDKAPFITPNPVDDQIIPMVVPKITEPQLIPQATPEKLPQVEMQIPPLYVQGLVGGIIGVREELTTVHELAFEGSQTLEQFAETLKESSKGTKEEARQLAIEAAQTHDAQKAAKLALKDAIHAAKMALAQTLDKEFENTQAAKELQLAIEKAAQVSQVETGTIDTWTPEGQVVAPIIFRTPSLTEEAQARLQAEDKEFELAQAARQLAEAIKNFNSKSQVETGTTDTWTPEGQVVAPIVFQTPSLTLEAQARLQAEDKEFELAQAARELEEATENAQPQPQPLGSEFGTFTHIEGTVSAPTAIVAPSLTEEAQARLQAEDKEFELAQAARELAEAIKNFDSKSQVETGTTDTWTPEAQVVAPIIFQTPSLTEEAQARLQEEDKQFELAQAARELEEATKNAQVQVLPEFGTHVNAYGTISQDVVYAIPSLTPEAQARLEKEAREFAKTASQNPNVNIQAPVRHELTEEATRDLDASLAANLKAMQIQSQSPMGIPGAQERIAREMAARAVAVEEEQKRLAIQAELDRLVAEQEKREAEYAAKFASSFYSPAYNNFMTGIFTDYEKLAKEYELQSVTNENQRWLGDLFATRFSAPVPRAQSMLDQLAKMTGILDRTQAGFLGQPLVDQIYGRTDVAGIRIAVSNGNIEVRIVGTNNINPDSVIETAKIPYTVIPTSTSATLVPTQSVALQLADNAQDFKQVVVEQVAQQFKNMIAQTVNGNTATQFGIQMLAYDIMNKLAEDIRGGAHFQVVPVEQDVVESFRAAMHASYIDRNVFISSMQQAIQTKVRQAFEAIKMQPTGWRLIGAFGSMDNFLSQLISSIQSMY